MAPPLRDDGTSRVPARRAAKVAESLAREIVQEIASRRLPPGTLLATEAQMLEKYGVGRGSLREALRILEVSGLIRIKPGPHGGPIVGKVGPRDFGRMSTLFFHLDGVTLRQLWEARLVLEPCLARLAADRREIGLVDELPDPECTQVEDDDTYVRATNEFHKAVAAMSGNPVLSLLSASLEAIARDQGPGVGASVDERRTVLAAQAAIAQAIADGKSDEAEQLMRQHMRRYSDRLQSLAPTSLDAVIDLQ